ncbi:hypothetical protein [Tenacibaculum sp. SDUM215027]|uniref:hypothetical protein n=1 Tax=Tenacibaculum sp. SDUM215027 TaxID=3422596 RepID=UPI003D319EAE
MKKILMFSITISLFGIQKISAQNYLNYYETINKAEIANLNSHLKKSDSLYQIAFELVEKPFKEDFLLASINSEKLNENQKTFDYLKKGINNGLTLKRIKKQLSDFKRTKEWKKLKKEYNSLRENHLKTLNLPLREEISEMVRNDQKARTPIFGSWKQMKKTDSYNYNRLLEIIKENNNKWPGFSIIGEMTPKGKYDITKNITLMPLHFKKEWIEKLRPYMLEAVLNGEMYPYHFARIIDYTVSHKNISQKKKNNGTIISESCYLYGSYLNVTVCDCKKAKVKRKKIGFEPLKDYYRKRKSNYKCYEQE